MIGEYTDDETRRPLTARVKTDSLLTPLAYESLVAAMVQAQHEVADGSEGRVGKEFVLTTLPLHAAGDVQPAMMPLGSKGLAGDAATKHLVGVKFDGEGRLAVSFAPGGVALSLARGGMAMAGIELRPGTANQIGQRHTLGTTPLLVPKGHSSRRPKRSQRWDDERVGVQTWRRRGTAVTEAAGDIVAHDVTHCREPPWRIRQGSLAART